MARRRLKQTEYEKGSGETRNFSINCDAELDSNDGVSELLTGTPTVVERTSGDLTITNKIVSTTALVINDRDVAIGKAVQFRVAGGTPGVTYTIDIDVSTDGGQVLQYELPFRVK